MLHDLRATKKQLASAFIRKPIQSMEIGMKAVFNPIEHVLYTAINHSKAGQFHISNPDQVKSYFIPILQEYTQISSMAVASTTGYEYNLMESSGQWLSRTVNYANDTLAHWKRLAWPSLAIDSSWTLTALDDPRSRPWYTGAMKQHGEPTWTTQYTFNTNHAPGMTVACVYPDFTAPDSLALLAFDLTIEDLFTYISAIRISENGYGVVLTADRQFIKPPPKLMDNGYAPTALKTLRTRTGAIDEWEPFRFERNHETWWAQFVKHPIDAHNYLIIGVVLPEKDMMAEVVRSEKIIYLGMGITVLFVLALLWVNAQTARANSQLELSNATINKQSVVMIEKNKEILQSIRSARRLQNAMLPPPERIKKLLPESFILNLPKDVVSGDFYWVDQRKNTLFWTVADCTGHGVPGAFMSIFGMDLIKVSFARKQIYSPAHHLVNVRNRLIERLVSSESQTKDGMDIVMCSFDKDTQTLKAVGAMNSLFLVRSKPTASELETSTNRGSVSISPQLENTSHSLFVVEGDRVPISFTYSEQVTDFTEYQFQIQPGDVIYLSTDGFADQFGGPRGKKFGRPRFRQLLLDLQAFPIQQQEKEIHKAFVEWKGEEDQVDDVCVMGVHFL